jgi:hypothetical protein
MKMVAETVDHLQVARYIADIDSNARSKGIQLSIRTDFEQLWDLCGRLPGKPLPAVLFDPKATSINAENALWVEGVNARNEVVHVQAVRFDDLTGTTLASEIDSLSKHFATPDQQEAVERTKFCHAPSASEITGRVCYHGEIWLKGGSSGYRGQGLSTSLPRLVLALALAKWMPDYIWGLGHSWLIERGIPQKYGYRHLEPRGAYMENSRFSRPVDSWIMWMTQSDLIDLTHHEQKRDLAAGMGY